MVAAKPSADGDMLSKMRLIDLQLYCLCHTQCCDVHFASPWRGIMHYARSLHFNQSWLPAGINMFTYSAFLVSIGYLAARPYEQIMCIQHVLLKKGAELQILPLSDQSASHGWLCLLAVASSLALAWPAVAAVNLVAQPLGSKHIVPNVPFNAGKFLCNTRFGTGFAAEVTVPEHLHVVMCSSAGLAVCSLCTCVQWCFRMKSESEVVFEGGLHMERCTAAVALA